jgi:hypothetical protein
MIYLQFFSNVMVLLCALGILEREDIMRGYTLGSKLASSVRVLFWSIVSLIISYVLLGKIMYGVGLDRHAIVGFTYLPPINDKIESTLISVTIAAFAVFFLWVRRNDKPKG